MDSVRVETTGDAAGQLRGMMTRLLNHSELLPKLGEMATVSQKGNIEESREPDGTPYPPLKHVRPDGSDHPLFDTGVMYDSIHWEIDAVDSVFSGPSLSAAPYFPNQNQGAPGAHIPARVFIGLRAEDVTEAEDLAIHHANDALNG